MEKNTIIALVLSSLVIIGAFVVQTVFFPPEPFPGNMPTEPMSSDTMPLNENQAAETDIPGFVVQDEHTTVTDAGLTEQRRIIETDLLRVEFTNRGGDILSYQLKNHSSDGQFIEMADNVSERNRAFSIQLGDAQGFPLDQLFHIHEIGPNAIGFYRDVTVKNNDGSNSTFTLAKQYTFYPGDYMFKLEVIIDGKENMNGLQFNQAAYTIRTSPQIGPTWNPAQNRYDYRKFFHHSDGKKRTNDLKENQTRVIDEKLAWTAVAGKYFTLIALPEAPVANAFFTTQTTVDGQNAAQMFLTRTAFSSTRVIDTWRFYLGPRTEQQLSRYNLAMNNPHGLSETGIDGVLENLGILAPLEIFLKWLMELLYVLIPNWGVSIILLTILMRLVLFPLTKKSSEATLKMQELQPKIKEIQDKHKGNPQKMNEEMAKFYQTAGYNPLSGCLPMLIQFPLIFAMYNLFNNYFEFRGALFIPGWIPDLSRGDSVMRLPFSVPIVGWTDLRLLPVIYVISQLIFGKVTQTPAAAQSNATMKIMMYGMPLFFFFMFYDAPSGLLLYWTFSNILTMVQQIIINKMMHSKRQALSKA